MSSKWVTKTMDMSRADEWYAVHAADALERLPKLEREGIELKRRVFELEEALSLLAMVYTLTGDHDTGHTGTDCALCTASALLDTGGDDE